MLVSLSAKLSINAREMKEAGAHKTMEDDVAGLTEEMKKKYFKEQEEKRKEEDRIAEEKEKMIVDIREKWCKQIMDTALQITIKKLGLQSLVDLFANNSFMAHRAHDGGNCVFVIDAGLDSDAAAFDRQSPFSTPPKLDPTAAKNFVEAFEKIPSRSPCTLACP